MMLNTCVPFLLIRRTEDLAYFTLKRSHREKKLQRNCAWFCSKVSNTDWKNRVFSHSFTKFQCYDARSERAVAPQTRSARDPGIEMMQSLDARRFRRREPLSPTGQPAPQPAQPSRLEPPRPSFNFRNTPHTPQRNKYFQ